MFEWHMLKMNFEQGNRLVGILPVVLGLKEVLGAYGNSVTLLITCSPTRAAISLFS